MNENIITYLHLSCYLRAAEFFLCFMTPTILDKSALTGFVSQSVVLKNSIRKLMQQGFSLDVNLLPTFSVDICFGFCKVILLIH